MTPEEVEKIIDLPIQEWPIKPLVFVPMERTLTLPSQVLPPLIHLAHRGANFMWMPYGRTDYVRNEAAKGLLSRPEFDVLIMLDSDHVHDPQIVSKLCRWMLLDPQIRVVGGLNYQRNPPHKPAFLMLDEDGNQAVPLSHPDELFTVDILGTGSIAIHKSVFTQLEPPWFKYEYDDYWTNYFPGEDVYFSKRCREAGIGLFVDPECTSPHIHDELVDEETWKRWYSEHGLRDSQGNIR